MPIPLDQRGSQSCTVWKTSSWLRHTHRGGTIREIAGNDEIMVSLTVRQGEVAAIQHGTVILRIKRDGIPGERLLVNVRMADLAMFLETYPVGGAGLEHVFDY